MLQAEGRRALPIVGDRVLPFRAGPRGVVVGRLSERHSYAFNYDCPNGVRLLSNAATARLTELQSGYGESLATYSALDTALVREGLVPSPDGTYRVEPRSSSPSTALNVWLHIVDGCNLACHYCYIPHLEKAIAPEHIGLRSMSTKVAVQLLEDLVSYCEAHGLTRLHIKFAGGEPTLNMGAVRDVCTAAEHLETPVLVSFGMISNGVFDPRVIFPILRRFKISLSISVDGVGESHDRVRFTKTAHGSREPSWRVVWANLVRAEAEGLRPFVLHTLSASNAGGLSALAALLQEHRIGFRISLVRSPSRVRPDQELRLIQVLQQLYDRLGRTADPFLPIERFVRFAEWNLQRRKTSACGSCRNYFAADRGGSLSSCQMRLDRAVPMDGDVASAIDALRRDSTLAGLTDPGARTGGCSQCLYFHTCSGGCPEHTRSVYGEVDRPSPWCRVFGELVPVYVEAVARQLYRACLAIA